MSIKTINQKIKAIDKEMARLWIENTWSVREKHKAEYTKLSLQRNQLKQELK